MYLIMSWFANVSNCRNFEILRNIHFDFFQVQNWNSQQGRDSCLKKKILRNISKIGHSNMAK
jgi:hypothetical protein